MGWVNKDPTLDARGHLSRRYWIIDVLAQYAISCDGNALGEPDVTAEPASLPPPLDDDTLSSADRSDDVNVLKNDLATRYSTAAHWTGKGDATDDQFGGLFLERLTSARNKQAAAVKARQILTALQADFGAPAAADAEFYTTRDPGAFTVTIGQELIVKGDTDPATGLYPKAWIAFVEVERAHRFCRVGNEPGNTGIADIEFLISSDVSW